MSTVLRVCLGKHHQFDVSWVPLELGKRLDQIINLIISERQPQRLVGLCQCRTTARQHRNPVGGARFFAMEQQLCAAHFMEHSLRHAIV